MSITTTTTQSWGSRIGGSLKGFLFGLALIVGAAIFLFWNEGRSIYTKLALKQAQSEVQLVADTSKIDPAMEGKLVHMAGTATTQERLQDKEFGITYHGIRLSRSVQIYQWVEVEHTTEHESAGGNVTKTTTYSYEKRWVDKPVLTGTFREPGYRNTVCMRHVDQQRWQAGKVNLGAFRLNARQIDRVNNSHPYSLEGYKAPAGFPVRYKVMGNELYLTAPGSPLNPDNPQIGDMRVTWNVVSPKEEASLIAVQFRDTFTPYTADVKLSETLSTFIDQSSEEKVDLFTCGIKSADEMFHNAHEENKMMTWFYRFAGWLAMLIGIHMVLRPIAVLASVLPFLGHLLEAGLLAISFLLSTIVSLVVISIAWLTYRPVVGISLLILVVGIIVWWFTRKKAFRTVKATR